jgi:hypothetical protein
VDDIRINTVEGTVIRIKVFNKNDPSHYAMFRITTNENSVNNGDIGDIFLEEIGGD